MLGSETWVQRLIKLLKFRKHQGRLIRQPLPSCLIPQQEILARLSADIRNVPRHKRRQYVIAPIRQRPAQNRSQHIRQRSVKRALAEHMFTPAQGDREQRPDLFVGGFASAFGDGITSRTGLANNRVASYLRESACAGHSLDDFGHIRQDLFTLGALLPPSARKC